MINRNAHWRLLLTLSLALGVAGCPTDSDDDDSATDDDDSVGDDDDAVTSSIYDIASGSEDFETLTAAIDAAGLDGTLDDDSAGPLTVFAPTDAAFEALPAGLLGTLLDDTNLLTSILTYHVVDGAVNAETVVTLDSATTLQGEDIAIDASNGVVLNGSVTVTMTDIEATNGIVHVIDAVLVPPSIELPVDLVDTAVAAGFTELAAALTATDLVETLKGEGPFTVFAPTDEAFEAVAGVTAGLTTQQLTDVLLYHVVSGEVDAETVVTLDTATTVQGEDISIDTSNGVVLNGNAEVTMTDVKASNGIIHVIDAVILPPSFQ